MWGGREASKTPKAQQAASPALCSPGLALTSPGTWKPSAPSPTVPCRNAEQQGEGRTRSVLPTPPASRAPSTLPDVLPAVLVTALPGRELLQPRASFPSIWRQAQAQLAAVKPQTSCVCSWLSAAASRALGQLITAREPWGTARPLSKEECSIGIARLSHHWQTWHLFQPVQDSKAFPSC